MPRKLVSHQCANEYSNYSNIRILCHEYHYSYSYSLYFEIRILFEYSNIFHKYSLQICLTFWQNFLIFCTKFKSFQRKYSSAIIECKLFVTNSHPQISLLLLSRIFFMKIFFYLVNLGKLFEYIRIFEQLAVFEYIRIISESTNNIRIRIR